MKIFKSILVLLLLAGIAFVVGYMVFTYTQVF